MSDLDRGGIHRGFKGSRIMGQPWNRADLAAVATNLFQAPALLNQANPTQNQWYNILPTTVNVRLYSLNIGVDTANETLECELIIDGVTIALLPLAAVAGTAYQLSIETWDQTAAYLFSTANYSTIFSNGCFLEGRSVQVRVRKTTAVGAGNLRGKVLYGVYT